MAAFTADSLHYNGFDFDDTAYFISSKVRSIPIYDDAKRMIKGVDFTIDVKGKLTGGTDAQMDILRTTLTTPGKILKYNSRGYGEFVINDPAGEVFDSNWGPKPGEFNYMPLGMGEACAFEWNITTRIPTCENSVYQRALMMANYEVDFDIDEQGLTTIAVRGAIEIPLTFLGGNLLPDNADAYRELCFPVVPDGFQRASKKSKLSADRKRLDFSYVDKELPVPLPRGCTMADVRHHVRNKRPYFTAQKLWSNTISGTIRSSPVVPKITAFDRFLTIVIQRMQRAVAAQAIPPQNPVQLPPPAGALPWWQVASGVAAGIGLGGFGGGGGAVNQRPTTLIPGFLDITESIFSLDSNFSVSYDIMVAKGLSGLIEASGLWSSVGTEHGAWRRSMDDGPNDPRGTARMRYLNTEDTFVDLCSSDRTQPVRRDSSQRVAFDGLNDANAADPQVYVASGENALSPSLFSSSPPDPETSWLDYQTFLLYDQDDNIAIHKPSAGVVSLKSSNVSPFSDDITKQTNFSLNATSDTPDITQRVSTPSVRVVLMGAAMRLNYPINSPRLESFEGKEVEQLSAQILTGTAGAARDMPIHVTTWRIVYVVKSPPDTLPVLVNPMYNAANGFNLQTALLGG